MLDRTFQLHMKVFQTHTEPFYYCVPLLPIKSLMFLCKTRKKKEKRFHGNMECTLKIDRSSLKMHVMQSSIVPYRCFSRLPFCRYSKQRALCISVAVTGFPSHSIITFSSSLQKPTNRTIF